MCVPCPHVFPPSRCIVGLHFLTRPRIDAERSSAAVVTYSLTLIRVDRLLALFTTLGKRKVRCLVCDFNFGLHQLVSPVTTCTLGTQIKVAPSIRPHTPTLLLSAFFNADSSHPFSSVFLAPLVLCLACYDDISGQAHRVHVSRPPSPPAGLSAQPAPPLPPMTTPFF